ncbi:MAG: hypothetical protein LBL17_01360 [Coxiellaceae bacterium]|jgi:hypothetical protein|nr:hypothetical protein [Coxiellaceae bacterium]
MINDPQVTTPKETTENLQKNLTQINTDKKQLETIKSKLQGLLTKINDILLEQNTIWSNHTEKYSNELVTQLEKLNIKLTTEEKKILSDINYFSIEEKREKLKKLNVKIPDKATHFTVSVYDTVCTALSRTLQKIDDINKIIRKLPAIKDEAEDARNIQTQYQKQYEELIKLAIELKKQALAIPGISEEQFANIQLLVKTTPALQKAITSKVVEEETQKLEQKSSKVNV